jgi:hypothetical protein
MEGRWYVPFVDGSILIKFEEGPIAARKVYLYFKTKIALSALPPLTASVVLYR